MAHSRLHIEGLTLRVLELDDSCSILIRSGLYLAPWPTFAHGRQIRSPRRQASLVPSRASNSRLLNVSLEARTSEILCKPMGKHNEWLTSGGSNIL